MSIRITLCPTCGKQTGMYESGRSDSIAANKCECPVASGQLAREVLGKAAQRLIDLVGLGLHHMQPTREDVFLRQQAQEMVEEFEASAANVNLDRVLYWLASSEISVCREEADAPLSFEEGWALIDGNGDGDGPQSLQNALHVSVEAIRADERAALAATGDAPLTAEDLQGMLDQLCTDDDTDDGKPTSRAIGRELVRAYTTLVAQIAALRAERDRLAAENAALEKMVRVATEAVRCLNGLTLEHERDLAYYEAELGVTRRRVLSPPEVPLLDAEINRVHAIRDLIISALELRRIGVFSPLLDATPTRPTDTGRDG